MMERGENRKGVKSWLVPVLLLMSLSVLEACTVKQQAGRGEEISILYHGTVCREDVADPVVVWFGRSSDLHQLDGDFLESLQGSVVASLMSFDFSGNGILLLSPGNRRTANYDIRLNCSVLDIEDDTALLQLEFLEKNTGTQVNAAESCTPSVLLKVPKGDYHHIQARDGKGLFMVKIRVH